ncbi:MAG: ATP-grasp domain-containing protein [Lachnospiraceae bacterium]|nr:ATP-grasp domain-containing protein [Lachnospiraceae bacterium]
MLTSAGRRTYMVDYFKEALRGEGLVFVANSAMSPALTHGDGYFLTPLIYSREYIPFLLDKCRELKIGLLVSLFDIDLPVLAAHRDDFSAAGTFAAVSEPEMLRHCNDKYDMYLKLREGGIGCPETALFPVLHGVQEEASELFGGGPVIVKPRFGMGSIGLYRAVGRTELQGAVAMCSREIRETYLKYESAEAPGQSVIVQKALNGTEYGLDVICDLDRNYVTTIVRRKLGMRSGETDEAVILGPEDPEYDILQDTGRKLAALLRPRGLTDVDVMMEPGSGKPFVIDINARFGGGYPFSHIAGADVPRAYVLWMKGEDSEARKACMGAKAGTHGFKDIALKVMPAAQTDETVTGSGKHV